MDEQELEKKKQAAREAGYTDEQIEAYLSGQDSRVQQQPPATIDRTAEAATTGAMAVAPYAVPAALAGAGAYGAFKVGGWAKGLAESAKGVSDAMKSQSAAAEKNVQLQRERIAERQARQMPQGRPGPVGPSAMPAQPVAPQAAAPQPAAQPAAMNNQVRQIAMDRVMSAGQRLAPMARGLGGLMSLATPSNVGQDYPYPMSGPLRGSEINPATRRPWTKEELQQYYQQMR